MDEAGTGSDNNRHERDVSIWKDKMSGSENGGQKKDSDRTIHHPSSVSSTSTPTPYVESASRLPALLSAQGPTNPSEHKRNFSGNILSKFSFLRSADDDSSQPLRDQESQGSSYDYFTKSRKSVDDDTPITSPTSPTEGENAMTAALKASQTRKRKGSLRKTALLGGRRVANEGRERRNSLLRGSSNKSMAPQTTRQAQHLPVTGPVNGVSFALADGQSSIVTRQPSYDSSPDSITTGSTSRVKPTALPPVPPLSLMTEHASQSEVPDSFKDPLGSPLDMKSPPSNNSSYNSTTDEDDMLTFDRPVSSSFTTPRATVSLNKPLSSAATSYFPAASDASLTRSRTSSKQRRSPLSHTISSSSLDFKIEPHDYTETEYWGWVILFVTWLTFTVGMGSCLDIWSWAWAVGETPYAPPELEDDPTLPIVGYYPALIVLTGVVAWCWITVAWVGMKYFRHAKIEV